jgi:hypothetical protein
VKRVRFLEDGRRAHPSDVTFPQLQHEAGKSYDLPDEMADCALASRNAKGEPRCELDEDQPEVEAPVADDSKAKGGKREDKKGRGAKALE